MPAIPSPAPALFDPGGGFNSAGGINLAPPETIDFGASAAPVVSSRAGPSRPLVLIVLLGAAAIGAKLGQVVTRADVAALNVTKETMAAGQPDSFVIAPTVHEHEQSK
jgi:hypothetical protein